MKVIVTRWVWGLALLGAVATAQATDTQLRHALGRALDAPRPATDRFAQQVWFQDYVGRLRPFVDSPQRRRRLTRMVLAEAQRAKVAPGLVFAVIEVESDFNRFALSYAGARGLMQVMPFWQEKIGRPEDNLFHSRTNLRYGCTILNHYLDREDGDILNALAAYNGSSGRTVYPEKIYRAYRQRWREE
ncbi:transglycosylase SLT domain-containing protein [Thiohalorhabdus sp.]|uniref:transglycosylase SLT domain-containing protein n=1 Tax=Thiohalorhabdus sp. TaxID=3094134 RepID=UPI002FC33D18